MGEIPLSVISDLILVGHEGRPLIPASLSNPDDALRALMVGDEPWEALGTSLDASELEGLIRGLVLFGEASGFTGGSVSPVIPLYAKFARRFPPREDDLNRWIRMHGGQPFRCVSDAPNFAAYEALGRAAVQRAKAHDAFEASQQRAAKIRRAEVATTRLPGCVERGDTNAVIALLAKGADADAALPDGTSLIAHAEAHGHLAIADLLRARGASSPET